MSKTHKQIIGDSYEYFVLDQIRKDFDFVWHWNEFPEKLMYFNNIIRDYDRFKKYRLDIGADLVAMKDNHYFFIQCKNYADTICMTDLAGFYFLLYEYDLNGLLYYNGKLSQRVQDLSTGKIQFINMPFNNNRIDVPMTPIKLTPRDYQSMAYLKLKGLDRAILSLPCGMGKTYISSMLGKHYDNILILSPLRCLAQQTLNQYKLYLGNTYEPILISVDGLRDIKTIKSVLKDRNIISSTYDSADIVIKLIDGLKNLFIVVDEFHNLSKRNIENKKDNINRLICSKHNRLFLSATPLTEFMKIDENHIYRYGWNDAIHNRYICDFNVYVPDKTIKLEDFKELLGKSCNINDNDQKMASKIYFMLKGMMYNGNRKCICYLTDVVKAEKASYTLEWIGKMLNVEYESWIIDYRTARTKRTESIKQFSESRKLSVLFNVHVLDEGINIPECDSVFITQPNNNITNLVQRMCRANRITNTKDKSDIYMWCREKKTEGIIQYISNNTMDCIKNKVKRLDVLNDVEPKSKKYNYDKNYKNVVEDFIKTNNLDFMIIKENYIKFENKQINVIIDNNAKLWFNANDIAVSLGYKYPKNAIINNVDQEDKIQLQDINTDIKVKKHPHSIYLNESGLYSLIILSRLPKTKKFKKMDYNGRITIY